MAHPPQLHGLKTAVTASETAAERERCLSAGIYDDITKPFRAAELIQPVEAVAPVSGALPDSAQPETKPASPPEPAPTTEAATPVLD